MSETEPAEISRRQTNLRYLLNQWDPLDVADIVGMNTTPVGTALGRLVRGAGRSEISEFLWYEIERHFGLDPARYGVDRQSPETVET